MTHQGRRATLFNIAANAFLFAIKYTGALMTGSLALMSDAINSFSDTIYSIAIFFAVKVSHKKADNDHPFGHHRAEPVAGLLVALLAGILGFEIIKAGVEGLLSPEVRVFSYLAVGILAFTMLMKALMSLYFHGVAKKINSPALAASSVDCRNDVLVSFIAMLGVLGPYLNFPNLDYCAAIAIGLFIIYSGYKIGTENIDYLMGKAPGKETMDEITKRALSVKGVKGLHKVRAHYVGNYLHVQAHVEVDKNMTLQKAHDLGETVEDRIEEMHSVDKAFIHVDPR